MDNFWKSLPIPFTVLAPMDDVTDWAFRELIASTAKPDVMFTEFTSASGLSSHGFNRVKKKLEYDEKHKPIVAQLWGTDPSAFNKSAQIIRDMGFDGIDINMSCPARKVMGKGAGAGLITNITLAKEIIRAVKDGAGDLPVSIKTRLTSSEEKTEEWIRFLLTEHPAALTIHARTAKEMSKVPARWEEIGKAVQLKNILSPETIIIGNGDVKNFKEVIEKNEVYGVDGVMIGRGTFLNPWVFDKSEKPETHQTQDYLDLLKQHMNLFHQKRGAKGNFESLKKFLKMYIHDFKGADALRNKLMLSKSYDEMYTELVNFKIPQRK